MDIVGLIVFLAIGAAAGWLAGLVMGRGFSLLGNIAVGVIGAVIAGFLLPGILPIGGIIGQILHATIGAIILLFVLKLIKR